MYVKNVQYIIFYKLMLFYTFYHLPKKYILFVFKFTMKS